MAKKTYTVTASTGYAGYAEGETFEAELTEEQERRALERGSIKAGKQSKKEEKGDA